MSIYSSLIEVNVHNLAYKSVHKLHKYSLQNIKKIQCDCSIELKLSLLYLWCFQTHFNFPPFCRFPGTSLTVNMWNPSLRGVFGRLFSYPQAPSTTEYCLTFFYKLYGPNTGEVWGQDETERWGVMLWCLKLHPGGRVCILRRGNAMKVKLLIL